ncbi:hypothetical protein EVAR_38229_1 [Eumeta japonica]|uniref:Uncharacterized protein n=1 Tax=Eumeta variegata TaxID=151549 RepID=A0A4C1XIY1_EUMVA|nr:hypothetical protein EVAR_38229_1 [Eumeta japonica]
MLYRYRTVVRKFSDCRLAAFYDAHGNGRVCPILVPEKTGGGYHIVQDNSYSLKKFELLVHCQRCSVSSAVSFKRGRSSGRARGGTIKCGFLKLYENKLLRQRPPARGMSRPAKQLRPRSF